MSDDIRAKAERALRLHNDAAPHIKAREQCQLLGELAREWLQIRKPEIDTDSCDRIARMEQLVKRLANLDTTNNWPWRCELARLIQEAKELTDDQA